MKKDKNMYIFSISASARSRLKRIANYYLPTVVTSTCFLNLAIEKIGYYNYIKHT